MPKEERRCLQCRELIDTVKRPRSKMCSKRCHNTRQYEGYRLGEGSKRSSQPKPRPAPPLFETETIMLSIPAGRLRYTDSRALWRRSADEPEVVVHGEWAINPAAELDEVRVFHERRWWNLRYLAALKLAADKPTSPLNIPQENQHNEQ